MIISAYASCADEKEFRRVKETLEGEGWKTVQLEYVEAATGKKHVSSIFYREV